VFSASHDRGEGAPRCDHDGLGDPAGCDQLACRHFSAHVRRVMGRFLQPICATVKDAAAAGVEGSMYAMGRVAIAPRPRRRSRRSHLTVRLGGRRGASSLVFSAPGSSSSLSATAHRLWTACKAQMEHARLNSFVSRLRIRARPPMFGVSHAYSENRDRIGGSRPMGVLGRRQ